MVTYALLGATGATGSAVLRCLLSSPPPNLRLNILIRNRSKLLQAFPGLESRDFIHIFVGSPSTSDRSVLESSLRDADVILNCIASNTSVRRDTLYRDTASAIVDSLTSLRQDQGVEYHFPTILILRPALLNPSIAPTVPWIGRKILWFFLYYMYDDIQKAAIFYETKATENEGLFSYIFVDAPALHDPHGDTPTGYELALELTGANAKEMSYADLGRAFCEIAERRAEFAGKGIAVWGTGKVKTNYGLLMGYLWQGLKSRIF